MSPTARRQAMPEPRTDVAVVGGGVTGLSAALQLAGAGVGVTVIDAGEHAGSDANAGSLHVQLQSRFLRLFPDQAPNVIASLPAYLAAIRAWMALDERLDGIELVRSGGLMLAESPAQMAFLERKAATEARHGLDVDILSRDAVERLAPWLGPQVAGAELCRDEGKVNPLTANRALGAAVRQAGGRLLRARVASIRRLPAGLRLCHDAGALDADRVILAAAWGTRDLSAGLGAGIPVAAEPLHMNVTEPAEPAIRHLVQHAERPVTIKQFRSGHIIIGGGWPAAFAPAAPAVLAASMLGNVAMAARLAPGIRALRVIRAWAGLNTTADGKTILGPLPTAPRVIIAVPGDAGYTLGPLVGGMAADLVLGRPPALDPAPFSPERFASP